MPTGALLLGYHDAVCAQTIGRVAQLKPSGRDRIGRRVLGPAGEPGRPAVSVIGDDLQHAGQAAYVRGVVSRRTD